MFERTFLRFTFVMKVPYFMLEARDRRTVSNNTAQLVLFWDSRLCTTVCSTYLYVLLLWIYPVRTRFFYLVKVLILGCLSTMKPKTFWSCICNLCSPVFHNIFSIYINGNFWKYLVNLLCIKIRMQLQKIVGPILFWCDTSTNMYTIHK